ncbi:hypothetical protein HYPSUDRAFT_478483 [Hypholoma sublateritium FD-334 SS-4]|uniref:Uncharacterized protein n=1 Tax=Hypholoma sublateritium (strain FD-334 SS-4) TaxID=945553 RepID=A0A0D2P7H6_HYPSF|nr:hypothetical protein HYPSUDRAFT_478483 [Hypholoma sublateritium FD-334 SS-4]
MILILMIYLTYQYFSRGRSVKEEEVRRSAKKDHISSTRRQQLQLAHVNPAKHKKSNTSVPRRPVEISPSHVLRQSDRLDQASLSRVLVAQAVKEAQTITEKKAAEWEKHGGHVNAAPEIPAKGLAAAMQTIAEQGLKVAEASAANRMDTDDDEDEDDDDWDPTLRGSASPEPTGNYDPGSGDENDQNHENDENDEDNENDEDTPVQQDVDMANVEDSEENENEDRTIRSARRMVITSDSEGENDENDENAPIQHRATSSAESLGEDEHDKENNNELMYDHSDDKENTAVVRHPLLTRGSRGVFDDITAPASPEGLMADWGARSQRLSAEDDGKTRRPFQDLLSDRSPSATQLSSSLTQSFATQLQQASPLPSTLAPAPTLKSFLGSGSVNSMSFSGFSQFSEGGDSESFGPVPLLQPGFSDLFGSATERQRTPRRAVEGREATDEDIFCGNANEGQLKRTGSLDLTQDVSIALNLQPAFQVTEGLMRKADAIFEKEQAFIMESALQKPNKKPELYVNDHGCEEYIIIASL